MTWISEMQETNEKTIIHVVLKIGQFLMFRLATNLKKMKRIKISFFCYWYSMMWNRFLRNILSFFTLFNSKQNESVTKMTIETDAKKILVINRPFNKKSIILIQLLWKWPTHELVKYPENQLDWINMIC